MRRQVDCPVGAIGDADAVLPAVVAGEAVQGEQVRILEVDRAGVLVGDVHILGRRRGDELDSRREALGAAEEAADERPAQVGRDRGDEAAVPAFLAAIDGDRRQQGVVGMIDVAAGKGGQHQLLAERRDAALLPARAGEGALAVLAFGPENGEAVGLELDLAVEPGIDASASARRSPAGRSAAGLTRSVTRRPWKAQPAIEI